MEGIDIPAFGRESVNSIPGSIAVLTRGQSLALFFRKNAAAFVLALVSLITVLLRSRARGRWDSLPFTAAAGLVIVAIFLFVVIHGQRHRAHSIADDAGDRTWFARGELRETAAGSNRVFPPGVVNMFATDTGVIAVADEDYRFWTDVDVQRVDAVLGPTGQLAALTLLIGSEVFELRVMSGRLNMR